MLPSVRYLLAKVHGTIAICMGTSGGFDEEYCGHMMVVSRIVWQLVPEAASDAIASISTAMQGARASFKHGRQARARSSNFPVSSKRLASFKSPADWFGNSSLIDSRLNNAFRFVEWAQNEIAVVPDFHKRILFSNEAHFWLNGYVNKQNCRIWSEANPQVYVETPLHPEKLAVWCALWAGGIIGPYFFKNDEGHNELWFQQDGATCHTARATIDFLKDTFGDHLISCFRPVNWPPRSCDLTQLDYFMWSYVRSLVYADKPQTRDNLEDNIRRVIADIRPQMLEKVIENWMSRLDYIRASRGSHMPEIIFKILEKAFASEMVSDESKPKVLLCMLGDKVSNLLVNLGEEELKDYESLKQVVLKEYEPSPQKYV
ncbi:DUF4817 domain-containing protein [Trichonephila clavipes]|nr:DUF4817 domain-containing protein [Trichonephila clavipes]